MDRPDDLTRACGVMDRQEEAERQAKPINGAAVASFSDAAETDDWKPDWDPVVIEMDILTAVEQGLVSTSYLENQVIGPRPFLARAAVEAVAIEKGVDIQRAMEVGLIEPPGSYYDDSDVPPHLQDWWQEMPAEDEMDRQEEDIDHQAKGNGAATGNGSSPHDTES